MWGVAACISWLNWMAAGTSGTFGKVSEMVSYGEFSGVNHNCSCWREFHSSCRMLHEFAAGWMALMYSVGQPEGGMRYDCRRSIVDSKVSHGEECV